VTEVASYGSPHVNPHVRRKLEITPPDPAVVSRYLIEISGGVCDGCEDAYQHTAPSTYGEQSAYPDMTGGVPQQPQFPQFPGPPGGGGVSQQARYNPNPGPPPDMSGMPPFPAPPTYGVGGGAQQGVPPPQVGPSNPIPPPQQGYNADPAPRTPPAPGGGTSSDMDLDDLQARFEALKGKTNTLK